MSTLLKAMGALLSYPQVELVEALPEIGQAMQADPQLPREHLPDLLSLIDQLSRQDLISTQEHYVELFDRGRATSLHLFEHVHGDSRERGMAMIDLLERYHQAGLALNASELPDYLPVVLEYLSTRPEDEQRETLDDCAHILRKIGEALLRRDSAYSSVFAALLALARQAGLDPAHRPTASEEKSLDEEWVEEPVTFGPSSSPGCGSRQDGSSVIHFVPRLH